MLTSLELRRCRHGRRRCHCFRFRCRCCRLLPPISSPTYPIAGPPTHPGGPWRQGIERLGGAGRAAPPAPSGRPGRQPDRASAGAVAGGPAWLLPHLAAATDKFAGSSREEAGSLPAFPPRLLQAARLPHAAPHAAPTLCRAVPCRAAHRAYQPGGEAQLGVEARRAQAQRDERVGMPVAAVPPADAGAFPEGWVLPGTGLCRGGAKACMHGSQAELAAQGGTPRAAAARAAVTRPISAAATRTSSSVSALLPLAPCRCAGAVLHGLAAAPAGAAAAAGAHAACRAGGHRHHQPLAHLVLDLARSPLPLQSHYGGHSESLPNTWTWQLPIQTPG